MPPLLVPEYIWQLLLEMLKNVYKLTTERDIISNPSYTKNLELNTREVQSSKN